MKAQKKKLEAIRKLEKNKKAQTKADITKSRQDERSEIEAEAIERDIEIPQDVINRRAIAYGKLEKEPAIVDPTAVDALKKQRATERVALEQPIQAPPTAATKQELNDEYTKLYKEVVKDLK